jgi:dTDP-4-dehydrorhamnose 3,5-epimerase
LIEGFVVREIKKNLDERGFFAELLRSDWDNIFPEEAIVQLNLSHSYPGVVRAWHRHNRGQFDCFICVSGSVKVCAYDDRPNSKNIGEIDEVVLSRESLTLVKIPGYAWHGYKVIGNEPATLLYGVNNLYDYKNPDEERRPWNDASIIPLSINGKSNDPRVGKPWDWQYIPNK